MYLLTVTPKALAPTEQFSSSMFKLSNSLLIRPFKITFWAQARFLFCSRNWQKLATSNTSVKEQGSEVNKIHPSVESFGKSALLEEFNRTKMAETLQCRSDNPQLMELSSKHPTNTKVQIQIVAFKTYINFGLEKRHSRCVSPKYGVFISFPAISLKLAWNLTNGPYIFCHIWTK